MCTVNADTSDSLMEQVTAHLVLLSELDTQKKEGIRMAELCEPLDWQKSHSPFEPIEVSADWNKDKRVRTEVYWRRALNHPVWNDLCSLHKDAAIHLRHLGVLVTSGLVQSQGYDKTDQSSLDVAARLHIRFGEGIVGFGTLRDWAAACRRWGLNPEAALDVVWFERGLRATDRKYGQRRNTTRDNLKFCLQVFCIQQCWTPEPPKMNIKRNRAAQTRPLT